LSARWRPGRSGDEPRHRLDRSDSAEPPCKQIGEAETTFGTIGPSLHNFGKLRGVNDPAAAEPAPIVQYTWGNLYNCKATNACSVMPRFGHSGLLTPEQMRHVMAQLLDPKSTVNE
jgi:sulfur-oxidizing protein SoxX